jgi:hypothetical protein
MSQKKCELGHQDKPCLLTLENPKRQRIKYEEVVWNPIPCVNHRLSHLRGRQSERTRARMVPPPPVE